ncbi:hypothetical protein D3C76_906950 [compost metagenome]
MDLLFERFHLQASQRVNDFVLADEVQAQRDLVFRHDFLANEIHLLLSVINRFDHHRHRPFPVVVFPGSQFSLQNLIVEQKSGLVAGDFVSLHISGQFRQDRTVDLGRQLRVSDIRMQERMLFQDVPIGIGARHQQFHELAVLVMQHVFMVHYPYEIELPHQVLILKKQLQLFPLHDERFRDIQHDDGALRPRCIPIGPRIELSHITSFMEKQTALVRLNRYLFKHFRSLLKFRPLDEGSHRSFGGISIKISGLSVILQDIEFRKAAHHSANLLPLPSEQNSRNSALRYPRITWPHCGALKLAAGILSIGL